MADVKEGRNKGGRPPKETRGGLTKILGFRLRPTLRAQLEEAAQRESRSISEECEYRLNRSFLNEAAAAELFGRPEQRPLMLALCNAIRMAGEWGEDEDVPLETYAAAITVVEGLSGKAAADIVREADAADRTAWRRAAASAVSLERGSPLPENKPLSEIMGR